MMKGQHRTTAEKATTHDSLFPLLKAMFGEFKELSKKKPDAAVSKSKITIVNRLLEKLRLVLADEDAIDFLDLLDEDDVPQASDVTLMLSQYVASMDAFYAKYYGWDGTNDVWFIG
jgi:hypothetical protein